VTGQDNPLFDEAGKAFGKRFYPEAVVIRGIGLENLREEITSKITAPVALSFGIESQQQDENLKQEAIMSLFVLKPRQTGVASVAEATAEAIRNPQQTAIVVLDAPEQGEALTAEEQADVAALKTTLATTDAPVFGDVSSAVEHVNTVAENGIAIP